MNIKHFLIGTAAGALMLGASIVPAFAAGEIGDVFSSADPGTVGPSISGDLYGNTSNPSGNGEGVLPSFSPGPWKCGNPLDCAGPTDPGGSMGEFLAPVASGGTASPDFANGNDPDIDFSLH
ncbi:MAG: hypothetical protein Q8Q49_02650 [bacterium]|nr:hypothetical protein [bacterium]